MIEPNQTSETLYDRLMRLKPEGLTTRAWTINAGVGSGFFDNIASGRAPNDGELPRILAVVGITLADFEGRGRPASPPAPPPSLRVMPRVPRVAAEDAPEPAVEGSDAAAGDDPPFADATAEAIRRWLEARRQATAAGLDTSGIEGARVVTDLARLALDLERRHLP